VTAQEIVAKMRVQYERVDVQVDDVTRAIELDRFVRDGRRHPRNLRPRPR